MDKYKKNEVSLSTFNYLFSELITYLSSKNQSHLKENIKRIGGDIGLRLFNMMIHRQKITERESKIMPMLRFVQSNVFKYIFGKQAQKIVSHQTKQKKILFGIIDNSPIILKFIPQNEHVNCALFVCGIIQSILCSAGFQCEVDLNQDYGNYPETEYLIYFTDQVFKKYKIQ